MGVAKEAVKEGAQYTEIVRGDVTIHNESVLQGSERNTSWQRAYVLAFHTAECVAEERALDFSHSHNDSFNRGAFRKWDEAAAPAVEKEVAPAAGTGSC